MRLAAWSTWGPMLGGRQLAVSRREDGAVALHQCSRAQTLDRAGTVQPCLTTAVSELAATQHLLRAWLAPSSLAVLMRSTIAADYDAGAWGSTAQWRLATRHAAVLHRWVRRRGPRGAACSGQTPRFQISQHAVGLAWVGVEDLTPWVRTWSDDKNPLIPVHEPVEMPVTMAEN